MERLTIKNNDGSYSQPTNTTFEKLFYKVVEFEDFMEEQGFESLELLKATLKMKTQSIKGFEKLKQENQALKDRWNKLKEYIEKEINNDSHFFNQSNESIYAHYIVAEQQVLDFMEKLEKGNDDER